GAAGMYLGLHLPWGGGGAHVATDAAVVATAKPDAGTKPAKPHRRPGNRPARSGSSSDDDTEGPPPPPLTDSDRRLEWRGEDTTLPPKSIDMSNAAEARSLDDSEINAV